MKDRASAQPRLVKRPPREPARLPGEAGTWIFILGDMTVFALLFGVVVDARAKSPGVFRASQRALNPDYGVVSTLLLLTSSLLVVIAVRAIRRGDAGPAPKLLGGAIACGLGFSLVKALEWGDKFSHHIDPATNDFWLYYFIFTGLHFLHLLLGMGVLGFLLAQSRRPTLSERRLAAVEGGACFWHMVDLLWIILFPLFYFVG